MLVLVMGSALVFRLGQYAYTPKTFIAFYGIDKLRFTGAVKIGDTIRLEVEVLELTAKDDKRGIVTTKGTVKNQRDEDCCVFVSKMLCGRKPEGA